MNCEKCTAEFQERLSALYDELPELASSVFPPSTVKMGPCTHEPEPEPESWPSPDASRAERAAFYGCALSEVE